MIDDTNTLVSAGWLNAHLKDSNLRILDASWYLPGDPRDPKVEYAKGHIPEARFFDIDDVSDHRSDLPHMVPPVEKFLSRVRALGIGDGHQIVVYDTEGLFSAARVWWLFRMMGHDNIAVLDGGLPAWIAAGYPVTKADPKIRDRHMYADPRPHMVMDATQVSHAAKLKSHEILDARAADRFAGAAPEPRPGLRAGHIPGSKNVPFKTLLNADGTMKSTDELCAIFDAEGVDLSKPIITTCGSGVTAAVIVLALERIGKTDHALYDGSWVEWGASTVLPVETS